MEGGDRENEQLSEEFVQCPLSRFVFPKKCARMQHRSIYQVVKNHLGYLSLLGVGYLPSGLWDEVYAKLG
jgi:hypothetical protein